MVFYFGIFQTGNGSCEHSSLVFIKIIHIPVLISFVTPVAWSIQMIAANICDLYIHLKKDKAWLLTTVVSWRIQHCTSHISPSDMWKTSFLTYEFNLSTAVWCCCDCCCSSDGFQEPIHPTLLLTGEVYIWHQLVHEQNGFSCLGFISVHLVHWQGKKVDDETDQSLSSISSSSFHCQSPS